MAQQHEVLCHQHHHLPPEPAPHRQLKRVPIQQLPLLTPQPSEASRLLPVTILSVC